MTRQATVILAVLLTWAVAVTAQGLGTYEQITVSTTAVGLATSTTNPTGRSQMNTCYVRLEAGSVRWRDDGTDPTATVGYPFVTGGDELTITSAVYARRIRFIRSATADGTLSVRCYP